jgi:hypothetical protein
MKKIYNLFFATNIQQLFLPFCFITTVSTTSLISNPFNLSSRAAEAFTVSTTEVTNYAQAVLKMEPVRQEAFKKIKILISGKEVPQIACNLPSSFNSLPREANDIAVSYCKQSNKIVEDNNLTIDRFNRITQEIQGNNILRQQIYNELLRLQKALGGK